MKKTSSISFQKFKDFRLSLLSEDFQKYDGPEGLRSKLEKIQEILNDDINIQKLDAYFMKITNKSHEMQLLESVNSLLTQLEQIVKEK